MSFPEFLHKVHPFFVEACRRGIVQGATLRSAKDTETRRMQWHRQRHNHVMHILLIEDDLELGRALQSALKVEGLTSEWFRRAFDAPTKLDENAIDCVLLDLTLPDGSGFDLLKRWRSQGRKYRSS